MGNGTEIGRVRGLGSAKSGPHHWLLQRYTGAGNLILGVWFAVSLIRLPNYSYPTVTDWISQPVPAIAMVLFIISTLWHARLGLQVLFEDYVHEPANKFAITTLLNLAVFAAGAFGVFCIIRLALGGA